MESFVLNIFLGFVAVPLSSFLKNVDWTPQQKIALVTVVCFVFGLITTFLNKEFNVENVLQSFAVVFTTSTLFYRAYFEYTEVNRNLEERKVF